MGQPEHSSIIAAAAKAALGPLGFKRQGRSRVWLGDRGYWLNIVEFQPSGFSKGSGLNVSAHWLWRPSDILSFDYMLPDRVHSFIDFQDRTQFEPLAADLAALAAAQTKRLDEHLQSFADVARILNEQEQHISEMPHRPAPDWRTLHAAVANGIVGDVASATAMLTAFLDGPRGAGLQRWGELALRALHDAMFRDFIVGTINETRAGSGFAEWRGSFD